MTLETQNKWITFFLSLNLAANLLILVAAVYFYDQWPHLKARIAYLEDRVEAIATPIPSPKK